jgi:lysophospholipase L1-like esterase
MKMNRRSVLSVVAASALALSLAACSNGSSSSTETTLAAKQAANAGNFSNTYFLGDSLTAGYQSSSLIDTSQPNGWAPLVAAQEKFSITLPLIASPGAPNQLTLVHLANPPLLSTLGQLPGVTTGRDNFAAQPTDVAVPGATTDDILNTLPLLNPTTGQQTLNQLVLGYPGFGFGVARSQAQQAVAANPTTIFLWAGNNEALAGVFAGTPAAMIPLSTFTTEYQNLIAYLNTKSSAHLVIGNIPDVTAIPYLQSATVLLGFFSQQTGAPISVLSAVLGIQPGDLVSLPGVQQVPGILGGTAKGPIASVNILHAADVPTVQANVAAYNKVIAASAQSAGATLVDINALFASITAKGITVNGVTGNVGYLGGVFSLDGIHPTNTAYAALANYFIDSMNTAFKQTAPDVNLVPIAAADPLFPPYPGHHAVEPVHGMAALTNMQLNSEQVRETLSHKQ